MTRETSDVQILVFPGLGHSGPEHWQAQEFGPETGAEWVAMDSQFDWDHPTAENWLRSFGAHLETHQGKKRVCVVAHSLACIATALWTRENIARAGNVIHRALFVAPADTEQNDSPREIEDTFRPVPLIHLPFKTTVIASTNDSVTQFPRAQEFARAWGSQMEDIGPAGHINRASNFGPWPKVHEFVSELLK